MVASPDQTSPAQDAPKQDAPKQVLVVDDHPVVRRGLRQLIDGQPGFASPWEAGTAAEALDLAGEQPLDLALVDVALGATSGIELTKQLRSQHPRLPVLALSMHDETIYAERALAAGARGYLMKRVPDEEIIRAIWAVLGGRIYVSDKVRERLFPLKKDIGEAQKKGEGASPMGRLSDRELEVFLLLGEGMAPRHIAGHLALSVKTIETYRRSLKEKLNLESSPELTRYAVAWCREHEPS